MFRRQFLLTHLLAALFGAFVAVVATVYIVHPKGRTQEKEHPSPDALRDASERLSKQLAIKFTDATSPAVDGQAVAILQSRQQARLILNSDSATDAEKNAAQIIDSQRTRQLETTATVRPGVKMINGRPAPPDAFQYQVAIVYAGAENPLYGLHCGGTLIDSSWVLTAAHCFNPDTQNGDFQIFTGSRKLSVGGRLVSIAKIVRNEYDPKTNERDIALIKLETPVTDQTPMNLADAVVEGKKTTRIVTISGWGVTAEGSGQASDQLLFAFVPLIANAACQTSYANLPPADKKDIKDDMICAGDGKADACQGDSGGPLVIKGPDNKAYLEGVVSWGEGCNRPRFPGVYARVPTYLPWIRSTMKAD